MRIIDFQSRYIYSSDFMAKDHIDDDIFYLDNVDAVRLLTTPYITDRLMITICLDGYAKGIFDLRDFQIKKDDLMIIFQGHIIQLKETNDDFQALTIIASASYSEEMRNNENIRVLLRLLTDPIIHLNSNESGMMIHFFKLIQNVIQADYNPHQLEVIKKLFEAMYYISISFNDLNTAQDKGLSRKEKVFDDFYKCLIRYHKQSREVKFYADKLCLTPKYMSNMIKEITGLSALEWINKYMILEAQMLLTTNPKKTIQEIADYLGFPDQSFFGKYFKKHTGVSPTEFRNQ